MTVASLLVHGSLGVYRILTPTIIDVGKLRVHPGRGGLAGGGSALLVGFLQERTSSQ